MLNMHHTRRRAYRLPSEQLPQLQPQPCPLVLRRNTCIKLSDDGDRLDGAALVPLLLSPCPLGAAAVGRRDCVLRRHAHAVKAGPAGSAVWSLDRGTCKAGKHGCQPTLPTGERTAASLKSLSQGCQSGETPRAACPPNLFLAAASSHGVAGPGSLHCTHHWSTPHRPARPAASTASPRRHSGPRAGCGTAGHRDSTVQDCTFGSAETGPAIAAAAGRASQPS